MRTIGGYVSSRKVRLRPKAKKPIMATMYSVHLQPKLGFIIMKPPTKGASKGPVKTVIEKTVMARPRVLLSNMSEKTAATTVRGQDPKTPAKKRDSITV